MIRIRKPVAPAVLTNDGAAATAAFNAAYLGGTRAFTFDREIYAHHDVKAALIAAQHGKCAFCESKITHITYGDVEHYRPKGAVRQSENHAAQQPGYYWLAYEWANLFLACQLCNQRFKHECFPLRVQKRRARSHADDLTLEEPLLVNPEAEDPARHITFAQETAVPTRSQKGKTTIEVLGLNRDDLKKRRLKRHQDLIAIRDSLQLLLATPSPSPEVRNHVIRLRLLLDEAIADEAEYAAMARVTLA